MKEKYIIRGLLILMFFSLCAGLWSSVYNIKEFSNKLFPESSTHLAQKAEHSEIHESTENQMVLTNNTIKPINPIWPLNPRGRITQNFGPHAHPVTGKKDWFHKGVDIAWKIGTPVLAPESGTVIETGNKPESMGVYIIIQNDSGYSILLSHLQYVKVKVDDNVKKGSEVAKLGNTGLSTGPHIHFQINDPKGKLVDPLLFFPEMNK